MCFQYSIKKALSIDGTELAMDEEELRSINQVRFRASFIHRAQKAKNVISVLSPARDPTDCKRTNLDRLQGTSYNLSLMLKYFYAILRDITCGAFNLLYIHIRCSLSFALFFLVIRAQIFAYEIEGKVTFFHIRSLMQFFLKSLIHNGIERVGVIIKYELISCGFSCRAIIVSRRKN